MGVVWWVDRGGGSFWKEDFLIFFLDGGFGLESDTVFGADSCAERDAVGGGAVVFEGFVFVFLSESDSSAGGNAVGGGAVGFVEFVVPALGALDFGADSCANDKSVWGGVVFRDFFVPGPFLPNLGRDGIVFLVCGERRSSLLAGPRRTKKMFPVELFAPASFDAAVYESSKNLTILQRSNSMSSQNAEPAGFNLEKCGGATCSNLFPFSERNLLSLMQVGFAE